MRIGQHLLNESAKLRKEVDNAPGLPPFGCTCGKHAPAGATPAGGSDLTRSKLETRPSSVKLRKGVKRPPSCLPVPPASVIPDLDVLELIGGGVDLEVLARVGHGCRRSCKELMLEPT